MSRRKLSPLARAILAGYSGPATPYVVSVSSASGDEGTTLVHTVTLSAPITVSPITLAFSLVDGTATAGLDYGTPTFNNGITLGTGVVNLPTGVYTTFTVSIPALTDALTEEATETYTLSVGGISAGGSIINVTAPSFYLVGSSPQFVTIVNQGRGNITSTSGGNIKPRVSPSRTSGVAPLYVNFDATATTKTGESNPEHNLFFAHNFGDTGAGTWANGVQSAGLTSKNAGFGPVSGHVYETPGTYTYSLNVLDGVETKTIQGTITVTDPDAVYAGANTICLSHSGNFIGAPAGSYQPNVIGNTDMYSLWNTHKASNKRILFCKADSWVSSATVTLAGLTGTTLGGYGTGAAHTFASGTLSSVTPATGISMVFQGGGSTDCRICNFKIAANASHIGAGANSADSVALTLYKIEVRGATAGFSSTTGGSGAGLCWQDQHCVYECLVDDVYGYAGAVADTPRVSGATVSTGGVFTSTGHNFKRFNKVQLTGTMPSGFSLATDYYISASNLTANTFSLSTSFGTDTPITSTTVGTCDVTAISLSGGIGAFVALKRGGFMGNYIDSCNYGEQTLRMPYLNTAHVNNNYLARPNQTKNVFKIHCRGYDEISPYSSGYSEKIVITANVMDLRGGYSYGDAIPNNGQTATWVGYSEIVIGNGGVSPGGERVRNAIIQHNFTYACLGSPRDMHAFVSVGCPNTTVRNNIADFSRGDRTTPTAGAYAFTGMYFATLASSNTQEQTVGVRFYNNTSYSNLTNAELANFVSIVKPTVDHADVDDVKIKNNLWYYPNATTLGKSAYRTAPGATPTNVSATNNTDTVAGGSATTSPNFVATPPVLLTDWRPTSGYAVDSGTTVPVLKDFNMAARTGTYDLGAVLP